MVKYNNKSNDSALMFGHDHNLNTQTKLLKACYYYIAYAMTPRIMNADLKLEHTRSNGLMPL